MSLIHDICRGLDVHMKTITECIVCSDSGEGERSEILEFERIFKEESQGSSSIIKDFLEKHHRYLLILLL